MIKKNKELAEQIESLSSQNKGFSTQKKDLITQKKALSAKNKSLLSQTKDLTLKNDELERQVRSEVLLLTLAHSGGAPQGAHGERVRGHGGGEPSLRWCIFDPHFPV